MIRTVSIISLLTIATVAVYFQTGEHEFLLADDPLYITDNAHVLGGLTAENILWAFTTGDAANWHPVTWLSHMADVSFVGRDPGKHHLISLFFHSLNSALLFLLLSRLTHDVWKSAFVTAVFAMHPLHVESVAWAMQRKDLLGALFFFLTLLSYTLYVERRRKQYYFLIIIFFSLGLMSKPMLVTLPFLLLLLDYWPLRRYALPTANLKDGSTRRETHTKESVGNLIKEKIPLFVLSAISSGITYLVQQQGGAVSTWTFLPLGSRIENSLVAYTGYLTSAFWPVNLAPFYPHPLGSLTWWQPLLAGIILLVVSVVAVRLHKTFPYIPVGWFWFLGTLVPVIGLIQVGEQAMADRYMYIPLIGLSIVFAWGADDLLSKFKNRRIIHAAGGTAIAVVLAGLTSIQVGYWKNSLTLFQHTVQVTRNNYVALTNLGTVFQSAGKVDSAVQYYKQALAVNGSYELARYNLAVAFHAQGEKEAAVTQYLHALRLQPRNAGAHYGVAMLLSDQGKFEEAASHYAKALTVDPNYWQAHYGLGLVYSRLNRLDSAIVHLERSLQIQPNYPDAHFQLGAVYHRTGQLSYAVGHYHRAITLKPDYAIAHANLGTALHQQGHIAEAIKQYETALKLDPQNAEARNNLRIATETQQRMK